MTSDIAKFRVRTAAFEVEYEGPAEAASARYDAMIEGLQSKSLPQLDSKLDQANHHDSLDKVKTKRGGIRSNVISKAVDALATEGWLKTKRSEDVLLQELHNRRVPGVDGNNLRQALNRRVRSGKLHCIEDNNSWIYWSDE